MRKQKNCSYLAIESLFVFIIKQIAYKFSGSCGDESEMRLIQREHITQMKKGSF